MAEFFQHKPPPRTLEADFFYSSIFLGLCPVVRGHDRKRSAKRFKWRPIKKTLKRSAIHGLKTGSPYCQPIAIPSKLSRTTEFCQEYRIQRNLYTRHNTVAVSCYIRSGSGVHMFSREETEGKNRFIHLLETNFFLHCSTKISQESEG